MLNALSIDVEEYFHPTEVQPFVDVKCWSGLPSRVEAQTMDVLEILANRNIRSTFFIVGWVAERYPRMVRAIAGAGHEIGCHSHMHALVYDLSPAEFRVDTERSVGAISDACGIRPTIYRAPTYSITSKSLWALEILVELGFQHDSSICPVVHDRYGIPGSSRHAHVIQTPSGPIYEVPVATARLRNGMVVPVGGGAYLRLLPYRYTAAGIRRMNDEDRAPRASTFIRGKLIRTSRALLAVLWPGRVRMEGSVRCGGNSRNWLLISALRQSATSIPFLTR